MPDDVDWHFVFKIKDDDVFRVCPPSNATLRAKRFEKSGTTNLDNLRDSEEKAKASFEDKLRRKEENEEPLRLGKYFNKLVKSTPF